MCDDLGEERGEDDEEYASFSPDDLLSESLVPCGDGFGDDALDGERLSGEDVRD